VGLPFEAERRNQWPLDPVWEEELFDRFMDRFEERMREQAIRQLGITGGQI
jgi:hypothetical protein